MPPESNAEGGTVGMPLEDKRLTPWLAQRFADRARPLAARPTIGTTALRLPHLDRQRDFGRSVDRLAGHVSGRTGPALSARPVTRSPIASRASDFVLRKLNLVQVGWRQALSLPFVQRLRGSRSGARQDMPAVTDTPSPSLAGQWTGSDRSAEQAPGPTFSEQDHPAETTVRGDTPVREKPAAPAAADPIIPSAIDTGPADTGHRLPDGEEATPESSQYAPIRSLPVTGGHRPVQQTTEDSDTSKSARGSLRPGESGGIDLSDQPRGVVTRQVDTAHAEGTQVRRELQHPDLADRVVRAVTRITRQTALQRSLLQARPELMSQRITGQQAPSIGYAYRQAGDQSEQLSETGATEKETEPFEAGLPAIQQARDLDIDSQRTPPDIAVPKRATRLLSRAFGDLQRSLIKPARQDRASRKFEASVPPPTSTEQGATISRSSTVEVPRSPDSEASPTLPGQAVISRSMTGPETHEVDTGISADSDHGPADRTAQRNSPPSHVPSIARSIVRSAPMIVPAARSMATPLRRLFRAMPATPAPAESGDRGVTQSRDHEPSSPGHRYAHQPAPALPVVSRVLPGADTSVARSAELLRYTSDAIPQVGHSGNHDGLDLAVATVNRATETRVEPSTAAPDLPKEKDEEKQTAPDIRALAREVYPLIKRMIMIERDRHPTWY
jgi:hypothetical protein